MSNTKEKDHLESISLIFDEIGMKQIIFSFIYNTSPEYLLFYKSPCERKNDRFYE